MGAFNFIAFVQPQSFCGDFYLFLRAITLYSTSWFVGNVCRLFAQMYAALHMFYGFCVCLCTAFAHVLRLLSTYMDYLLRKLCGFFVRIRIFVHVEWLCVRIQVILCNFWCGPSWGIRYRGIRSWGFFDLLLSVWTLAIHWNCPCERSWFVESLNDPILRVLLFAIVCANARDSLKLSLWTLVIHESLDDSILRVILFAIVRENNRDPLKVSMIRWVLFTRELFLSIGLSQGSNI